MDYKGEIMAALCRFYYVSKSWIKRGADLYKRYYSRIQGGLNNGAPMILGMRFHILMFLIITTLCLGGLGFVFVLRDGTIARSDQNMGQTRQVILKTHEVMSLIYSTLAIQRGYILSGDKAQLGEYEANKIQLAEGLAELKTLTRDNMKQKPRAEELQNQYFIFIGILDNMVTRYNREKSLGSLSDLKDVSALRRTLSNTSQQILGEEYQLLNEYILQLEKAKKDLYKHLSIGIILASILLTLLNSYLLVAQNRRMNAEESLRETEERLRLAIKGTNDGIYDWDIETDTLYWSPQFKNILGYEDNEIVASSETLDNLLHPDDRQAVRDSTQKYLSRELPELSLNFRLRHKDGRWIWVSMRGKAVFNEDGEATRLIGTYSDISSLKEYETRLEDAKNQAEKASAAKTEFLAHMSHEIRTPLTSISGVAEILMNQQKDFSPKLQQLVKVLNYSTMSLKELINDILDFSKIENGQLELENKPFNLGDLFQEIISIMAVRAQEKGLELSFDYTEVADIMFLGDKIRMRQIMTNLIGNALKFTHAGFVSVNVVKQKIEKNFYLQVEVQDSGIGIDPKNYDLVFERFRQADPSVSRKYGGTGLGLAISKNLAENMGGKISLSSELGKGSTFTVLLPLVVAGEQTEIPAPVQEHKTVIHQTRIGADEPRLLLVEDYEGNIAVLSYILEAMGYTFDIARTGLEAVNMWNDMHHNLILMDVQMPEMDGLTATRQIRKMEAEMGLPRTPIIGMTAHAFVEDKNKCVEAGMDSYLAKPIAENDLISEISRFTNGKEARQDWRASQAND